ncbi:MAG: ammonium transporter [Alphaproteobacteria bacterium]|nr:ammonium transporter [Alphaproteobacteria bacterium]
MKRGTAPSALRVVVSACAIVGALVLGGTTPALAQEASRGDTAWVLTATALVLFMTLPGLALFYGGLVRAQNVLSVLMQCAAIACLASLVWLALGYSLAFSSGGALDPLIGGLSKAFLAGVGPDSLTGTLPEPVFFMFQATFAIITPALIVGAFPERVSFATVLLFTALWLVLVYAPVCHWVWGGGWLAGLGAIDFAGGLVVHATAGTSALVFARLLGPRQGFPNELSPPHNPGLTMMGAAMLWVGWFGFNAGSALAADGLAGRAMLVTHISASTASLTWMAIEWSRYGKPSLVGLVTGTIAGLATITPAAGSVGPLGAVIIGAAAAVVCFEGVKIVKNRLRIDDSLDVFAVHGVGGILGTLLLPLLAGLGPLAPGLPEGRSVFGQLGVQAIGVVGVVIWSVVVSALILLAIRAVSRLRAPADAETEGLDLAVHGERGYTL